MTLCNSCIKILPIPSCADTWYVAHIPESYDGETLFYRVTDLATGRETIGYTEPVEAHDAHGYHVVITLPEDLQELMKHYYKLELFPDDTLLVPIEMTIDETTGCCIEFTTYSHSYSQVEFTTETCTTP